MQAVRLLKPEDITQLEIQPLGQRRLLEAALSSLEATTVTQPQPQPTQQLPLTAEQQFRTNDQRPPPPQPSDVTSSAAEALMQLGVSAQTPSVTPTPQSSTGEASLFKIKCLEITDFVRSNVAKSERVLLKDGEEEIVVRGGRQRVRLESVTPAQWMGASLPIMTELLFKSDLAPAHTGSYLYYMEKISDLAYRYTWGSVLAYDQEFRRWQAQTRVQWATDNIHLAEVYLEARPKPTKHGRDQRTRNGNNPSERPVCRLFNAGKCHFGAQCRYRHVCIS